MTDFFEHVAELRRGGQTFAVATVVGRRAPVSSHLGDRAIVFPDGRMEGFVGGACSREIVRQQALAALQTRQGRLVSIRPDATSMEDADAGQVTVAMSCASEGAVQVFIEPFGQARSLLVVGGTPVAHALVRLARSMDYQVTQAVEAGERRDVEPQASALGASVETIDALEQAIRRAGPAVATVVASQGQYDEPALESILKCDLPYVGLVASRKRGAAVCAELKDRGVQGLDVVRYPAGLDLGAQTPEEIALSILADIVQSRSARARAAAPAEPATAPPAEEPRAIDPVCGMQVDKATARHTAEAEGVRYYFCCAGCRARFVKDPQQYLARTA